jgi:hypothetical protein
MNERVMPIRDQVTKVPRFASGFELFTLKRSRVINTRLENASTSWFVFPGQFRSDNVLQTMLIQM